jgi:hypothetical protein
MSIIAWIILGLLADKLVPEPASILIARQFAGRVPPPGHLARRRRRGTSGRPLIPDRAAPEKGPAGRDRASPPASRATVSAGIRARPPLRVMSPISQN